MLTLILLNLRQSGRCCGEEKTGKHDAKRMREHAFLLRVPRARVAGSILIEA
jgi:hypothetical protein